MKQYLDLINVILASGTWRENRTGIRTISIPGAMMRFDLSKGFPAVTTRRLAFKAAVGEMIGFLRGAKSAEEFRALGCKVWDQNANENAEWLNNPYRSGIDDLGQIYGVQWRHWPAFKLLDSKEEREILDAQSKGYTRFNLSSDSVGSKTLMYKTVDQVRECLDKIMTRPNDRRILFHGWNIAQLDEMALPPCHLLYQFLPDAANREISLCLYVRSNDMGLGAPFNICEASILLHLVGRLTGYRPRWLSYFIGDAHIYENHLEMLEEQLRREPYESPALSISDRVPDFEKTKKYQPEWLELVEPSDFSLHEYKYHPSLTAPMAV